MIIGVGYVGIQVTPPVGNIRAGVTDYAVRTSSFRTTQSEQLDALHPTLDEICGEADDFWDAFGALCGH
jgi:hypothetical protein